jgi:hypothetical protein
MSRKKWKERKEKGNQMCYISPIWGEAYCGPITTKFGIGCPTADLITQENFCVLMNRGFGFTRGQNLGASIEMESHRYNSAALPRSM